MATSTIAMNPMSRDRLDSYILSGDTTSFVNPSILNVISTSNILID